MCLGHVQRNGIHNALRYREEREGRQCLREAHACVEKCRGKGGGGKGGVRT